MAIISRRRSRCVLTVFFVVGGTLLGLLHGFDSAEPVQPAEEEVPFPVETGQLVCGDIWRGSIVRPGETHAGILGLGEEQFASVALRQIEGSAPGTLNGQLITETSPWQTTLVMSGDPPTKHFFRQQDQASQRIELIAASDCTASCELGIDCLFPPEPLAGVLALGGVLTGEITSPVQPHQFTFDAEAGATFMLTTLAEGFAPVLNLFPPSQIRLGQFQFGGAWMLTAPETGTYVAQISDFHISSTGLFWFGLIEWVDLREAIPSTPVDAALSCETSASSLLITRHVQIQGRSSRQRRAA